MEGEHSYVISVPDPPQQLQCCARPINVTTRTSDDFTGRSDEDQSVTVQQAASVGDDLRARSINCCFHLWGSGPAAAVR